MKTITVRERDHIVDVKGDTIVQQIFDMFRVLLQQCLHIQARLELKKGKKENHGCSTHHA